MNSVTVLLLFMISVCFCDNINRAIYSNFRGNAQHDGYMKFGEETFKYPLKLSYNNTINQCEYYEPSRIPIFANNTYFCINNDNGKMNILSIDPISGQTNWKINMGLFNASWGGLQYTEGYISVINRAANPPHFYILNANNGDKLQDIVITDGSYKYVSAAATAYNGIFYLFYVAFVRKTGDVGGLMVIDPYNGIINSRAVGFAYENLANPSALPPTLCNNGEIIIVYASGCQTLQAFNTSTFNSIWYKYVYESSWSPTIPICLENKNQILFVSEGNNYQVIDVTNGTLIKIFSWYNMMPDSPYNVDRDILIYVVQSHVAALNISDTNPNNWNEIWHIDGTFGNDLVNGVIVDDSLILNYDLNQKGIVVLDIISGNKLWEYPFQQTPSFTPGINSNKKPMLIAVYEFVTVTENIMFVFE